MILSTFSSLYAIRLFRQKNYTFLLFIVIYYTKSSYFIFCAICRIILTAIWHTLSTYSFHIYPLSTIYRLVATLSLRSSYSSSCVLSISALIIILCIPSVCPYVLLYFMHFLYNILIYSYNLLPPLITWGG